MQHPPQNNMPVPGAPGGPPQQANGTGGPAGHDDSYFTEVSVHFLNISYVLLPGVCVKNLSTPYLHSRVIDFSILIPRR